jgi:hypothetical protein
VIAPALVLVVAAFAADAGAPAAASCVGELGDPPFKRRLLDLEKPGAALAEWTSSMLTALSAQTSVGACLISRLNVDPTLHGRAEMFFVVAPSGRVSNAAVRFSRAGERELQRCMAQALCGLRFPEVPTGVPVLIQNGFDLSQSSGSTPAVNWKPGECPGDDAVRAALRVSGEEWTPACRPAPGGRWLLAAIRRPDQKSRHLRLAAAIAAPNTPVSVLQVRLEGPEALKIRDLAGAAEDWRIAIAPLAASPPEVRVDVFGSSGEDLFIGQEIATFFWLEGTELRLLWTALGDKVDRRFDSCLLDSQATFKFMPGRRVQRTVNTTSTFQNGGVDPKEAARLRKECVAPPPAVETFLIKVEAQ